MRAPVALLTQDLPGHFFSRARAMGAGLRRLTLVSPWVGLSAGERTSLEDALRHAQRAGSVVYMVTRQPAERNRWHEQAVRRLAHLPRGRVYFHPTLHAKFFVAEADATSFAVVGSANLTLTGSRAREVGVAVYARSWGEDLINELLLLGQRLRYDQGVRMYEPPDGVGAPLE